MCLIALSLVDIVRSLFSIKMYTHSQNHLYFAILFQLMEAGVIGQNMENVQSLVVREHKLVHMSATILPRNTRVMIVTGAQRNQGLVK